MEQEIQKYLSIIDELGIKECIDRFYKELCGEQKVKRLFNLLFPYNNIYILSIFSKLLQESEFENENEVENELKTYCQWFFTGYNEFELVRMYDIDIFEFVVNFDCNKIPFFVVKDKIVIPPLYQYGKVSGKYYASWCYILNHQSVFEPLFKTLYETQITAELTNEMKLQSDIDVKSVFVNQQNEKDIQASIFLNEVSKYDFMKLEKINALPEINRHTFINTLISDGRLPYAIAMISYLGYIDLLSKDYNLNKTQIYEHLHKAFGKNERQVAGNIRSLENNDDLIKYTANRYIEIVENDYKKLLK